jgi:hypothetical protein
MFIPRSKRSIYEYMRRISEENPSTCSQIWTDPSVRYVPSDSLPVSNKPRQFVLILSGGCSDWHWRGSAVESKKRGFSWLQARSGWDKQIPPLSLPIEIHNYPTIYRRYTTAVVLRELWNKQTNQFYCSLPSLQCRFCDHKGITFNGGGLREGCGEYFTSRERKYQEGGKKCTQNFGPEVWREETISKTCM